MAVSDVLGGSWRGSASGLLLAEGRPPISLPGRSGAGSGRGNRRRPGYPLPAHPWTDRLRGVGGLPSRPGVLRGVDAVGARRGAACCARVADPNFAARSPARQTAGETKGAPNASLGRWRGAGRSSARWRSPARSCGRPFVVPTTDAAAGVPASGSFRAKAEGPTATRSRASRPPSAREPARRHPHGGQALSGWTETEGEPRGRGSAERRWVARSTSPSMRRRGLGSMPGRPFVEARLWPESLRPGAPPPAGSE